MQVGFGVSCAEPANASGAETTRQLLRSVEMQLSCNSCSNIHLSGSLQTQPCSVLTQGTTANSDALHKQSAAKHASYLSVKQHIANKDKQASIQLCLQDKSSASQEV